MIYYHFFSSIIYESLSLHIPTSLFLDLLSLHSMAPFMVRRWKVGWVVTSSCGSSLCKNNCDSFGLWFSLLTAPLLTMYAREMDMSGLGGGFPCWPQQCLWCCCQFWNNIMVWKPLIWIGFGCEMDILSKTFLNLMMLLMGWWVPCQFLWFVHLLVADPIPFRQSCSLSSLLIWLGSYTWL